MTQGTVSDEYADLEKLNPFTYRGHVWDAETGLYYMRARYYSPEYCRFISPDKIKYLGADGNILSYNAYVYCNNNPVNMCDATGEGALLAISGVLLDVAVSYLISKAVGEDFKPGWTIITSALSNLIKKPIWHSVYTGVITMFSAYQDGASFGAAVICGVVSGAVSQFSISDAVYKELVKEVQHPFSQKSTKVIVELSIGLEEELFVEAAVQTVVNITRETPPQTTRERNRENDLNCTTGGANIAIRTKMTR